MDNILYLDDFINLYSKKLMKLIIIKPYKDTLNAGRIINKEKFIKSFEKLKEKFKLNNNLISESITVIITSHIKNIDKQLLIEILEDLNYKDIKFINELEIIKIKKNIMFINYNHSYFYIYGMDKSGKIVFNIYENNVINKKVLLDIIKLWNKKEVIFTGKNYKELLNILKISKFNYYYFEKNDNLPIYLYLKGKNV